MSETVEAVPAQATPPATTPSTLDSVRSQFDDVKADAGVALSKAGDVVIEAADNAVDAAKAAAGNLGRRLRNNAELPADRGRTTIRHEVVEKIAGIAAREVPGVHDLGGDVARIFSSVKERIGLGEGESDQGVTVTLEGRTAAIEVVIVIEFGYVVHSVTDTVRVKVINSVENLLGLEVTGVDVIVDDVHVPEKAAAGDDQVRAADYVA